MSSSDERPLSVERVPTLTEVVELPVPLPPLRADLPFQSHSLQSDGLHGPQPAPAAGHTADVPQLGGLLLDDGSAWVAADQGPADWAAVDPHADVGGMRTIRAFDDQNDVGGNAGVPCDAPLGTPRATHHDTPFDPAFDHDADLDAEPAALSPVDPEMLVAQVLQELAPRIDLLFEATLRDAVAPALARAADGLVHDAREDMAAALRALVEQAVARALEARAPR